MRGVLFPAKLGPDSQRAVAVFIQLNLYTFIQFSAFNEEHVVHNIYVEVDPFNLLKAKYSD